MAGGRRRRSKGGEGCRFEIIQRCSMPLYTKRRKKTSSVSWNKSRFSAAETLYLATTRHGKSIRPQSASIKMTHATSNEWGNYLLKLGQRRTERCGIRSLTASPKPLTKTSNIHPNAAKSMTRWVSLSSPLRSTSISPPRFTRRQLLALKVSGRSQRGPLPNT